MIVGFQKVVAWATLGLLLGAPVAAHGAGPVRSKPAAETKTETKTDAPAAALSRAVLDVKEPTFDFGVLMENQPIEHAFEVRNPGPDTLLIQGVKPSCGCTVARFDRTIAPGGSGKISLTLDGKKVHGQFTKTATVTSNDATHSHLQLVIKGTMHQWVEVEPERIFIRGFKNEQPHAAVKVTSNLKEPLVIKALTSADLTGKVRWEVKTLQPGKEFQIEVSNVGGVGRYYGTLVLETDSRLKPKVPIPLYGDISGDIGYYPSTLEMGRMSAKDKEQPGRVVTLWKNRGPEFSLGKVTYDEARFAVEVKQQGPRYMVYVRPRMDQLALGEFKSEVKIETTSPDLPVIDIPVHGWVQ